MMILSNKHLAGLSVKKIVTDALKLSVLKEWNVWMYRRLVQGLYVKAVMKGTQEMVSNVMVCLT